MLTVNNEQVIDTDKFNAWMKEFNVSTRYYDKPKVMHETHPFDISRFKKKRKRNIFNILNILP